MIELGQLTAMCAVAQRWERALVGARHRGPLPVLAAAATLLIGLFPAAGKGCAAA